MQFKDRPDFAKKLKEMGKVVGRTLDDEDVKAYFNQLEEYPIELLLKGMDQALRDRDPADVFLKTTLVTVPEIRMAIEDLVRPEEGQASAMSGCKKCHGGGWIIGQDKQKRAIAWPCSCLYTVCKESLAKKGKGKARIDDAHRKRVIRAYEYHQKHWGGTK